MLGSKLSLSEEQVDQFWRLRAAGLPISRIAKRIGGSRNAAQAYVLRCGGVRPVARRRAADRLTLADREEISRGLAAGLSFRAIAAAMNPPRPGTTVSREVKRNGGRKRYRALRADHATWERARRPQKEHAALAHPPLKALVEDKLENEQWSPQQIAAWLRVEFPDDPEMWVSHETIYLSLFVQTRGLLRKELTKHLRTRRVIRHARTTNPDDRRGQVPGAVSIRERPAEVEDRAVAGHWEGDLLQGTYLDQIATLVERHSRFVMLVKIPTKNPDLVAQALARKITELPEELRKTLTWDRGTEMWHHADFTIATDVQVYFCDPASPWQRGSNENTNGLLRQYFPKGKSVAHLTQEELDAVARKLNTRPRQTLGWLTPSQALAKAMR